MAPGDTRSFTGNKTGCRYLTIAAALRIGAPVYELHVRRCDANITTSGLHNLACRFSAGRLARHTYLNEKIKTVLQTFGVPHLLEPCSLLRDDGRETYDITMFAYKHGKSMLG